MKNLTLSITALLIGLFLMGFSPINDEKINNEIKVEMASDYQKSDYCEGFYEGYLDGYKEECGVRGTGHPCIGDITDCRNTSNPYKCGYSQGYKKGTKDGIRNCH